MRIARWTIEVLLGLASATFAAEPVERPVEFRGAGDATIRGTLCLPPGASEASPVAALVLIAGSGPTDRDGNQPPAVVTDLLKQLAHALARDGVATLRCDKRGMAANAADMPRAAADLGPFFAWERFVDDAAAAHAFLARQPEVDAARVGLLGHSEGGSLALAAVARLPRPPAMLVLVGTPGRPPDVVIEDQLVAILARQGAPPDVAQTLLARNRAIAQAIRATGQIPADVPRGFAAVYPAYLGRFYQSEFALDPCKLAAAYAGPALVIVGERDAQTSPDKDARALDAAFAARPAGRHALLVAAGASHALKATAGTPGDAGHAGDVVPEVTATLDRWMVETGFATPTPTSAPIGR